MKLKDVSKIKEEARPIGALCPHCGGDLIKLPYKIAAGKIAMVLSLGLLQIYSYKCTNCKRKYKLI